MPKFSIGQGSKVLVAKTPTGNTAPAFIELIGVQDIELPEAVREEIDVTHMGSNGTKEFIAGLTDNGEVAVEMNWEPKSPTDVLLASIRKSGEPVQIRFAVVGADPETFACYCKGYTRTAPVGGKLSATATFRISGEITAA